MNKLTKKEFIEKSKSIHGNKYSYAKLDYHKNDELVTLTCPIHGDFKILPRDHLRKEAHIADATKGCKKCFKKPIKSLQQKYKAKKFAYDNYWFLKYSVDNDEYISVVKARSYDQSIDILLLKLKDEGLSVNLKSIEGEMFHKGYRFSGRKNPIINIKDWEDIRNCAFPNQNNHLFKIKIT